MGMSVDDGDTPEWLKRVREANKARLASKPQPTVFEVPDEDIPEVPKTDLSEGDEIDMLLAGVDILDAYIKWCGKTAQPKVGNRRESIMVSCPWHHPDSNPSAWINLDKQVIYCGACDFGGDIFAIAAERFGIDPRNYQSKENFPELKKRMAESMGYLVKVTPGGQKYIEAPAEAPVPEVPPQPVEEPVDEPSNVIAFPTANQFPESTDDREIPTIEWSEFVPKDSFLHSYVNATSIDDIAPEFHGWQALVAIGFAAGIDQLLEDMLPVKPSLNVILYGDTGSGKSRSIHPFTQTISEALPYDTDPYSESRGTNILPVPASPEALIRSFRREILDPSSQAVIGQALVRGLIKIDEFASFVARSSKPGSTMKPTMIDLFDVIEKPISTVSISGGKIEAKAFCQMVTSTQPQATHEFLRRTDLFSGFLNRFIPVMGKPRRARLAYGGFKYDMDDPIQYLKDLHQWCATERRMVLQGSALQLWEDFFHQTLVPTVDREDNPMMSRIDLFMKKLILLFTINLKQDNPTDETVFQATQLFDYLVRVFKLFSGDLSYDVNEECRLAILDAVKGRGTEGIKAKDMKRYVGHLSAKLIVDTLKVMVQMGELTEEISDNKRGPKTVRYKYVAD